MVDVRLEKALSQAEPEIRQAFLELVGLMGAAVPLSELVVLLEQGRIEEALARTLQAAPRLGRAANQQFINAANSVAQQINRRLGQVIVDFDQTSEFVVNALRQNQLRLIQGFTEQQRASTRVALLDAQLRGANPLETARAFRQSIGLTERQMQAVVNFRRSLEELSPAALRRQLRDARFDPTIARAVANKEPLSSAQIKRITDRYRERYIKHRSTVIARTEALRSVNAGNQAMFRQAYEEGALDPSGIEREWNTALDERVRGSHSAMHGQTRNATDPFISGNGYETDYPGGFGIPEEDIQCRCTVGTRITDAAIPGRVSVTVFEEEF
jgi:hypothetical protein